MRACIVIRAKRGRAEKVAGKVAGYPGVLHATAVFGSKDVVVLAKVAGLHELKRLVGEVGETRFVLSSETFPELEVA